jgi:hypothetical protein
MFTSSYSSHLLLLRRYTSHWTRDFVLFWNSVQCEFFVQSFRSWCISGFRRIKPVGFIPAALLIDVREMPPSQWYVLRGLWMFKTSRVYSAWLGLFPPQNFARSPCSFCWSGELKSVPSVRCCSHPVARYWRHYLDRGMHGNTCCLILRLWRRNCNTSELWKTFSYC